MILNEVLTLSKLNQVSRLNIPKTVKHAISIFKIRNMMTVLKVKHDHFIKTATAEIMHYIVFLSSPSPQHPLPPHLS